MGSVYKWARLTLVAAAASDSSEGCFFDAESVNPNALEIYNHHLSLPERFALIPRRPHFGDNVEQGV